MRGEERREGGGWGTCLNEIFLRLLNYQRALSYLAWPAHYFFLVSKMNKYTHRSFNPMDWTWEDLLVWALCQLTWILTAPPPSPPPPSPFTLFEFYDLSRNRVSVSPYIGKNNRHDFSFAELYPVLCQQFFLHFFLVLTNSFFHEKSLLSNFNPPLLHSYRQNPNIEPWTA